MTQQLSPSQHPPGDSSAPLLVLAWPWFRGLGHRYGGILKGQGFDVLLVTTNQHFAASEREVDEVILSTNPARAVLDVLALRRRLAKRKVHGLVMSGVKTPAWLPLLMMRNDVYEAIHDVQPHDSAHALHGLRALTRDIIRRSADAFIFFSESSRGQFYAARLADRRPSEVWPLLPETRVEARQPVANDDRRGFVVLGRFSEYKGFDIAIHAWAKLPEELKVEHPLTVLCNGVLPDRLRELVPSEQIHEGVFSWSLAQEAIAGARAVLLPYRAISQSGVQVLALALDTPTMSTRLPGFVEYASGACTHVSSTDPDDWTKAMVDLLATPFVPPTVPIPPTQLRVPKVLHG